MSHEYSKVFPNPQEEIALVTSKRAIINEAAILLGSHTLELRSCRERIVAKLFEVTKVESQ
ncbi:hypothetical protein JNUCC42_01240 [Brevibacterium sp. JNUCC-42]|nr:hypothetical protein JNUCC42_01240 [Brevibacterium sp. JNUCC-42]